MRACVYAYLLSGSAMSDSFATPWTVASQTPLSMGILQAKILEWVAVSSSRGSSQPRDRTSVFSVSCIGRRVLYTSATGSFSKHLLDMKNA